MCVKRFLLFTWFVNSLLFVSCAHDKNEAIFQQEDLSTEYVMRNSQNEVLKLNFYDLDSASLGQGPVWDPFVLPLLDKYKIHESDLLLGYMADQHNFIFPPQAGSCKILQKLKNYENRNKKLISFVSSNGNAKEDAGNLFMLLDESNSLPYALIKLNTQGIANCYLPNAIYHLSSNFGSKRKETIINTERKDVIKVDFMKRGVLQVQPQQKNIIHNGDLIRIGRIIKNDDSGLQEDSVPIPTPIGNDIYKQGNFQSQLLGADEILQTSILIGQHPFDIQLEEGSYVVAVIRKNNLICLNQIEIQENSSLSLNCNRTKFNNLEEKIFNKNSFHIIFDPTFFSDHLSQEAQFVKWFLSAKRYFMPILNRDERINNHDQDEAFFSFLFFSSQKKRVKQLRENFTLKINQQNSFLPPFGTGIEKISQGAIPFLNFTSVQFQQSIDAKNIFSRTYLGASNGVDIRVLEPFLAQDGNLVSVAEQSFRFRITVPPWNSTNIAEMNIDGKLHRRWVFNRGDLSRSFSITLDEKTFLKKDFIIRLTAWGEQPLPDFIYGIDNQLPFARTRDYTVNITGK